MLLQNPVTYEQATCAYILGTDWNCHHVIDDNTETSGGLIIFVDEKLF